MDIRKTLFGLEVPNCTRCGQPFICDPKKKRNILMLKHHTYGQKNESASNTCSFRTFVRAPDGGKTVGNTGKSIIYDFPGGLKAAQADLEQQALKEMKDGNEAQSG